MKNKVEKSNLTLEFRLILMFLVLSSVQCLSVMSYPKMTLVSKEQCNYYFTFSESIAVISQSN